MEAFPEVDVWICPTCEAKARRANRKVTYVNATEQEEKEEEEEEEEEEEDMKDEDYGVKKVAKGPARTKGKKVGEMKGWVMEETKHPNYPELKVRVLVKVTKESAQKKAGGKGEEEEEEREDLSKSPSSPTYRGTSQANAEKDSEEGSSTADTAVESGNEGATPARGKTGRRRSQSSRRSWATIYEESDTSVDEGDLQGEEEEEEFFDEHYSPVVTKCVSVHAYSTPKSRGQEEDDDYCQRPSAQREKKQPRKEGSSKRSHASREPYLCPVLGCDCVCDNRTSMMSHSYVLWRLPMMIFN